MLYRAEQNRLDDSFTVPWMEPTILFRSDAGRFQGIRPRAKKPDCGGNEATMATNNHVLFQIAALSAEAHNFLLDFHGGPNPSSAYGSRLDPSILQRASPTTEAFARRTIQARIRRPNRFSIPASLLLPGEG